MHDSWESIVGGGTHVHMVIRVYRLLATHLSTQNLNCSIGDNFVGVHV